MAFLQRTLSLNSIFKMIPWFLKSPKCPNPWTSHLHILFTHSLKRFKLGFTKPDDQFTLHSRRKLKLTISGLSEIRELLNKEESILPPDVHNTIRRNIMKLLESEEENDHKEGVKQLKSFVNAGYRRHKDMMKEALMDDSDKKGKIEQAALTLFYNLIKLEDLLTKGSSPTVGS